MRHTGSQVEFRLSYRGVAPQDPDYPAMVLLNRILGEGMSSRLQAELIDDMGLAYSLLLQVRPIPIVPPTISIAVSPLGSFSAVLKNL